MSAPGLARCSGGPARGSKPDPAQSRSCVAHDIDGPVQRVEAPTLTALVTSIRLALRSTPSRVRAYVGAIALATITCRTEIRGCTAASAEKAADGLLDRRTQLNRRTTNQTALLLHSFAFSDVVNSQASFAAARLPRVLVGPVSVSITRCSATSRIRERCASRLWAFLTSHTLRRHRNEPGHRGVSRYSAALRQTSYANRFAAGYAPFYAAINTHNAL